MPKTSARKSRIRKKGFKEQDDTDSESGKLSETQEVAKRLSRTRLGKENLKNSLQSDKRKGPSDPYDADSEVESDVNSKKENSVLKNAATPMSVESCSELPLSSVRRALRTKASKIFYHDQSTPSTATPGRSDDSLFGFASAMESPPPPFSPVILASPARSETSSVYSASSSTVMSPGKRKLQLRIFDMPIEKPCKKVKKKKTIQSRQAMDTDIHEVLNEFQEVEMFSLAIE